MTTRNSRVCAGGLPLIGVDWFSMSGSVRCRGIKLILIRPDHIKNINTLNRNKTGDSNAYIK